MSDERADAIPEARWPIVTAWIKAEPGKTGASPVTLGVGRDGPRVGYYSGGSWPADCSEHELWLRLDPRALAALPEVAAAAPHMRDREAEQWAPGERQAVLDCINLYGDETLHRALDDIGFVPRATQPDTERAPQDHIPTPAEVHAQPLLAHKRRVALDAERAPQEGFTALAVGGSRCHPFCSLPHGHDGPHERAPQGCPVCGGTGGGSAGLCPRCGGTGHERAPQSVPRQDELEAVAGAMLRVTSAPGYLVRLSDTEGIERENWLRNAREVIAALDAARRPDAERLRAAAKRVLEADMRGDRDLDALNALEDAAGFSQQGQRRATVFPESSRTANHDERH